jgi:single-stranded DNA-binding protein
MIEALIQGQIVGEPQKRQTRDGKPFYTASMRVSAGDGDAFFVGLTTFSETAGERLATLSKGASLSAVGALEQYQYQGKDGTDKSGWRLTATEIMSVYQARKRRTSEGDKNE